MQLYRGFPVLTNQASASERARAVHALVEVAEPEQEWTAAAYAAGGAARLRPGPGRPRLGGDQPAAPASTCAPRWLRLDIPSVQRARPARAAGERGRRGGRGGTSRRAERVGSRAPPRAWMRATPAGWCAPSRWSPRRTRRSGRGGTTSGARATATRRCLVGLDMPRDRSSTRASTGARAKWSKAAPWRRCGSIARPQGGANRGERRTCRGGPGRRRATGPRERHPPGHRLPRDPAPPGRRDHRGAADRLLAASTRRYARAATHLAAEASTLLSWTLPREPADIAAEILSRARSLARSAVTGREGIGSRDAIRQMAGFGERLSHRRGRGASAPARARATPPCSATATTGRGGRRHPGPRPRPRGADPRTPSPACASSTRTAASPRCAATASACSPAIWRSRGWWPPATNSWSRPWPGPIRPRILPDGRVRVGMGRGPLPQRAHRGRTTVGREVVRPRTGSARGLKFSFTFVDVGNPHCVIVAEDLGDLPLAEFGPGDRTPAPFPQPGERGVHPPGAERFGHHARVGARGGGDPGLRHRGHRRGRRRRASGADPEPGGGPPAGGRPGDRGGRRLADGDDRPGGRGVRRA